MDRPDPKSAGRSAPRPRDVAFRARNRISDSQWRRETYTLPREAARRKARDILDRFPKAAYMTEIEDWRVLEGDCIEFTMRRLPSAD
jgi:hypothetical protein